MKSVFTWLDVMRHYVIILNISRQEGPKAKGNTKDLAPFFTFSYNCFNGTSWVPDILLDD